MTKQFLQLIFIFILSMTISACKVVDKSKITVKLLNYAVVGKTNQPPVLDSISNISTSENILTALDAGQAGLDFDADNEVLTYSCYYDQVIDGDVSSTSLCTSITGLTFNTTLGQFSWRPNSIQSGNYEFVISATDSPLLLADKKIFTMSVADVPMVAPTLSVSDSPANTGYSLDGNINVVIGNDSAATKWCLSESQTTRPANTTTCTGSSWVTTRPTTKILSSGEGLKTLYVWLGNDEGDVSPSAVSATITVDTIVPTVVITSVANGDPINDANYLGLTVSGTCSEPGVTVWINGYSSVCSAGNTFSRSHSFEYSSDGPITFTLSNSYRDAAGNSAVSPNITLNKLTSPVAFISSLDDSDNLHALVEGIDIVAYKYKIGVSGGGVDCTNSAGYSAEIPTTTLVTDDTTAMPIGVHKICAVAKKATGVWQTYANASSATWTKQGAPTEIYRSVGPMNTTALEIGAGNTFTLTGSTAQFASPLDDRIGVGDAIEYDSNGDTVIDAIAFISSRTSSTQYTIRNALGAAPTAIAAPSNTTDWAIYRAYTSINSIAGGVENIGISAAVRNFDAANKDLGLLNQKLNIALYADAEEVGVIYLSGSILTTEKNHIKIYTPYSTTEVGVSQRHNGFISDAFTIRGEFIVNANYAYVEGIIIIDEDTSSNTVVVELASWSNPSAIINGVTGKTDTKIYFSNNIVKAAGTNSIQNISYARNYNEYYNYRQNYNRNYIYNNIFIDKTTQGGTRGFYSGTRDFGNSKQDRNILYNNTFSTISGTCILSNSGEILMLNNIFSGAGFTGWGGSNISPTPANGNATTNTGASSVFERTGQTFTFLDPNNDDYRLSTSDTGAKGFGLDLSNDPILPFMTDINKATRNPGSPWDIGASNAQ